MYRFLVGIIFLFCTSVYAQTEQRPEIQATQLNGVSVSVVYEQNSDCHGKTLVKWVYKLNEKIYVKAATLAIINHEGQIELRNIMNTESLKFDEVNNVLEYSFCASQRWTHSYRTKILDPTTGKVSRNIFVNVSVPIRQ